MADQPMTYAGSGVDYDALDEFKRLCQARAAQTDSNISRFGLSPVKASRGESVFLIEAQDHYLAHVEEGLGTKNLVADTTWPSTDWEPYPAPGFYEHLAQDTVAMIVNDMITLGALPISLAMHLAVGDKQYLADRWRMQSIAVGWERACNLAGAVWGPGETPLLRDIVEPNTMLLSGSAVGIITPKSNRVIGDIKVGQRIVILGSNGIHANGLTLARDIGARVGLDQPMSDGRAFFQGLLDPTAIYAGVVEELLRQGIRPSYMVNITGHGWRKFMRHPDPFVYVIEQVPQPQPVFRFLQERGPVEEREMYANYNMGAGFAIYVNEPDLADTLRIVKAHGYEFWLGRVNNASKHSAVVIEPLNITFAADELKVR